MMHGQKNIKIYTTDLTTSTFRCNIKKACTIPHILYMCFVRFWQ